MAVETLPPRPSTSPRPSPRGPVGARLRSVRLSGPVVAGLLVLLTLGSLLLRTRQLGFYYWVDEAISVGISSHPLGQLPDLLRQDGSPPLYYALLHVWMSLFGSGEVATHWLSEAFALAMVPAAYWAGASLSGRRAGAFCAVLAAGVPFLTSYAQETRMYSLLALESLFVAAAFTHVFVYRRRRYLPLFSLSLVAALYTHNWALFLGLASFLAFLVCVRATDGPRRRLWLDGALGFGAVALAYLPWLPTLLYQARHTGAPWALSPVVWSLSEGFYFITGGRGAAVALLLAGGVGLVGARTGLWRAAGERRAAVAALSLAVIGLGTLLIAWLYAKVTPAWSGRYLAVIVGPMTLLCGIGLARARGLGIAALVLVCCFWVLDPRPVAKDAKSNVALVAGAVRQRGVTPALVLSTQPEQVPVLAYYLPAAPRFGTPLGAVPDPRVMDWRNALQRFERSSVRGVLAPMVASLRPGQRVLLVVPDTFQKTPRWMALIHSSSTVWERYLMRDRRLRLVRDVSPRRYASGLPVQGLLFRVLSSPRR